MHRLALVLAAHGSHLNARSSAPARAHAAALRQTGRFSQVVCAFWKEFPSLRDVRYLVDADEVVVVPLFMADGYFAGRVVPRELGLTGPTTLLDGVPWRYTPPVGTDPRMVELLVDRAATAVGEGVPLDRVAVAVVGHGTVQNRHSKQAVLDHVAALAETGRFAQTLAAYMEEPPLVEDLVSLCEADCLVVIPLFVADGLHTDEDIPRALGLGRTVAGWRVPDSVAGKTIWYTSSAGTSPLMVELILDRVDAVTTTVGAPVRPAWADAWLAWLAAQAGPVAFLETLIERVGEGYRLRHRQAGPTAAIGLDELVEIVRTDARGDYRPLPTAPNLRAGWRLDNLDGDSLLTALEVIYPGAVALWQAERNKRLEVVSWQRLARRQTGQQGLVKRLEAADIRLAARCHCAPDQCGRRVLWSVADDEPPALEPVASPVPCPEPCSLFVSFARQVIGWRRGETVADDTPVWHRFRTLADTHQ